MISARFLKKFPTTFWIANTMELFERWGWYGFYMVFALYLTGSTDQGALGFSQTEKGLIMGMGTAFLYFAPIITGAIADRIGYRKALYLAYTIYIVCFLMMPLFKTFVAVFSIYLLLAIGAALFKPIITATVSKTTTVETSSIGFGIFYMIVNVGAFVGPFVTGFFRKFSWDFVFYSSAAVIAINFILVTFFYKELVVRDPNRTGITQQVRSIGSNIFKALSNWRFTLFLVIVSGFWTMYNQFYLTLPVFIDQWVDTTILYKSIQTISPLLASQLGTATGEIPAEYITNVAAGYIILFQIMISTLVMRFKPLHSMIGGIIIASIGLALSLSTQNALFIVLSLLIFAIGEMSSSPKITEYVGRISPPDKTALYMGCSYIPLALGYVFAGFVSGNVYQSLSDKIVLAQRELFSQHIQLPAISTTFSKREYFQLAASKMGMNDHQFTQYLWNKYNPSSFWIIVFSIGIGSSLLLMAYDRWIVKKK